MRGLLDRLRQRVAARPALDVLLPMVCGVSAVVYALHGFAGKMPRDSAFYIYGGQLVAEGEPPYAELFNRAGPIAHLLPGAGVLGARLVGGDDIVGVRLVFMLITVACVAAAYLLGRDLFRSRVVGLAAAAAVLSFNSFNFYATQGPREKTFMALCLLGVLLALVHQRWATTGLLIALGTLTWQPMFFGAFAGTVVAVLLGVRTGKWRALLRVAVGGAVPVAVTVLGFLAVGHLRTFIDDFLLVNARYTRQADATLEGVWTTLQGGYDWSVWGLLVGLVAALVAGVVAAWSHWRDWTPAAATLVGSAVMLLVTTYWTMGSYNAWPDSMVFVPFAAVGVGAVAASVRRYLPTPAAIAVVAVWFVGATSMAAHYSITDRNDELDRHRRLVADMMRVLPPDARLASVQAPLPLVLTDQRNPSRFQIFGLGVQDYIDDTWPGGIRGYGRWLVRQEPTAIVLQSGHSPPWLMAAMKGEYVRVGEALGITWFVDLDLGDRVEQARQVVRAKGRATTGSAGLLDCGWAILGSNQ